MIGLTVPHFSPPPTRSSSDGVDGPLAASRCQNAGWSETTGEQGAIHERDYDGRLRFGEECVPGAWGRCRGDDGSAQAASPGTSASILQSTTALSSWDGGVCEGSLQKGATSNANRVSSPWSTALGHGQCCWCQCS